MITKACRQLHNVGYIKRMFRNNLLSFLFEFKGIGRLHLFKHIIDISTPDTLSTKLYFWTLASSSMYFFHLHFPSLVFAVPYHLLIKRKEVREINFRKSEMKPFENVLGTAYSIF
jgi:hypothetical protein